ncbi:MAG: cupin domain-containing protein [Ruminococcus sp.]|nr:cupin domain-containing protein [Ruminococcus sp.]
MKYINKNEALKGQNSEVCKTLEYSFSDSDIDLGIATIKGRFPDKGYALNLVSKELVYVLEGEGVLHFENEKIEFQVGDAILINPNDKYYYETDYCVLSLTCTPAWNPNQHKIVS